MNMQVNIADPPAALPEPPDEREDIGSIVLWTEPLMPETRCGDVYERFRADPDLVTLAVVDKGQPVGLVNRHELTTHLARDYGRALYAGKSIAVLMDRQPLIVETNLHIDDLESLIASERPSALLRGFILTTGGKYAGVGNALSLLRLSVMRTERRNRDLERSRIEAETASRAKSRFLANMSHELRTPLNAIIGFAELIKSQTMGPLASGKYDDYVDDIHASGLHLLSIINDILDMAKIEDGKMVLHEDVMDLSRIVPSCLRMVYERAGRAGVTLDEDIATGLPGLYADERAVRQILLNLLSNSVKFTPPGGRVTVAARLNVDGSLRLSVRDTGIGIAPDHLETVMQPFGQVASAYSRRHDGTGLGLPLVKSLADLHGARFTIDSRVDHGTDVAIIFPPGRCGG